MGIIISVVMKALASHQCGPGPMRDLHESQLRLMRLSLRILEFYNFFSLKILFH